MDIPISPQLEKPNWVIVALEEYKSLRNESLEAIKNQHSVLQIGIPVIGVLIGAGFNLWNNENGLPEVLLIALTPLFSYSFLLRWLGELNRMMRAGRYLKEVEDKINIYYPNQAPPLFWENWLRLKQTKTSTPQMYLTYFSIIGLFMLTAAASSMVGLRKVYFEGENFFLEYFDVFLSTSVACFSVMTILIIYYISKFKKL